MTAQELGQILDSLAVGSSVAFINDGAYIVFTRAADSLKISLVACSNSGGYVFEYVSSMTQSLLESIVCADEIDSYVSDMMEVLENYISLPWEYTGNNGVYVGPPLGCNVF